jgi:hypothetical protein
MADPAGQPDFAEAAPIGAATWPDRCGAVIRRRMNDGPLRGEVFALYGAKGVDFNFVLADGRVAVYQTSLEDESNLMYFVGIDPLA